MSEEDNEYTTLFINIKTKTWKIQYFDLMRIRWLSETGSTATYIKLIPVAVPLPSRSQRRGQPQSDDNMSLTKFKGRGNEFVYEVGRL